MKRSTCILAFGLGSALVFHARAAVADLEVTPVHPAFQAPAGSSLLVEAVIANSSDDVVFLNSVSADLTDEFAGADLFDEFNAAAPDSLLPGESWEGPIVRLTLALDAPVSTTLQITVYFTGGVHPYDEENLAEFTFALNDPAVPVGVPTDPSPIWPGILRASPNPFRGASLIAFELPSPQWVEVQVYDLRGAAVRSLSRGLRDAGPQSLVWDGRNDLGRAVAPGLYFVNVRSEGGARRTKVVRIE